MAIARGEITITELYDGDNFYRAWADTPDGSVGFTTEESDRAYLGVYSGREEPTDYSQYKWSRIRGESAITAILSNDSHQIGTDENGNNQNYTGAKTTVAVFQGGEDDTSNWKINSIHVEPKGAVTGEIIDTYTYKVKSMTEDEASVTFKLTHKKGEYSPLEKTFTLSKNKQGISGQHAASYFLSFNDTAVRKFRETRTMEPAQLMMQGMSIKADQKPVVQSGYFKIYEQSEIALDRDQYEQAYMDERLDEEELYVISEKNYPLILTYTSKEPEEGLTYEYTDLKDIMSIKVYWYRDADFEELIDFQTISITSDGEKGEAGKDAISALLTNESITFAANKDGVVQNYVGNTGTFLLMEGAVNQSAGTDFKKVSETNVSATINEDNGCYIISSMTDGTSVTTGQATFSATYKGTIIEKTVTISKSIAGQTGEQGDPGAPGGKGDPGAPATSYWLTSSVDTVTVKYNGDYDPKTITYYGHSKTGSNNTQNYSGRFIIQTSIDGVNFTQAYLSSSNMDRVDFFIPEDVLFIKAKFYQAGGTTYLLDEQTTPILHSADGLKGVGLEDKDYQVGTEIYTEKADDSVVHVGIDGKSYQHVNPNARNMIPTDYKDWEDGDYHHLDGEKATIEGRIRVPWLVKVEPNTIYHWNTNYNSAHFVIRSFNSDGTFNSSWGGVGPSGSRTTSDSEHYLGIALFNTSGYEEKFNSGTIKPLFQLASHSDKSFEEFVPPAPTPDYPIEIHSLNDFDVVSGVGRNLILNSHLVPGSPNNIGQGAETLMRDEATPYYRLVGDVNISTYSFDGSATSSRFSEPMIDGATYTVSVDVRAPRVGWVGFFDSLGGQSLSETNEWVRIKHTYIYRGTSYRVIGLTYSSTIIDHKNWKIEKGTNATPWAPAPEDITENDNHPLIDKINLSLSEPLRSVGDVKDRLFRDSDGLWKVERNVGEYTFDGTESFSLETRIPELDIVQIYSTKKVSTVSRRGDDRGLSSHFAITTNRDALLSNPDIGERMNLHNSHGVIRFRVNTRKRFGKSVADTVASDLNDWLRNNPVTVVYELNTPVIESLEQEHQDKLNNLRSFQDSNYVYTIVNGETDIISERLKPTLHATFKGGGYYARWKSAHDLEKTTEYIEQEIKRTQNTAWIRAAMRIGYSSFTQTNPNSVYICGLEYKDGYKDMVLVDKPAEIYIRESNETALIPNQSLSVSGIPAGTTAYIVWDNTKKSLYLAYFESKMTETSVLKKRWRDISGQTITFTDSLFAIGEIEV